MRWPVALLAILVLVVTVASVFFFRSHSPARPVESQNETAGTLSEVSRLPQDNPVVLPSFGDNKGQFVADARGQEGNAFRPAQPRPSPIPQRSTRPPLDNNSPATVELTGIIGIPGKTKALLEITEAGHGRMLKKVLVQEGDRVDSIEVLRIDPEKAQVRIRNSGVEGSVSLKAPRLGTAAGNSQAGGQQPSFATPPRNWPPLFGDVNGALELRVTNPNGFSVRVGLRSGPHGKDFIVPSHGTETVRVPSGSYVTYFQYSSEPEGMYQGDGFALRENGAQITITRVVNGNYGIRRAN